VPKFKDLPFNSRPDLTPYLLHMTKNTNAKDEFSAFDNLVHILETGIIWGTGKKGYVKGPNKAACFMDVPFASLKYVLTPEAADPQNPRYEPYGVVVTKRSAYRKGARPVLYLSDTEVRTLGIPQEEIWRVVKLQTNRDEWISWLHEREWRCKGRFKLPSEVHAVLVKNSKDAARLAAKIGKNPKGFKCRPRSIIPLTVILQGLLK
jgi:hypothetical protein